MGTAGQTCCLRKIPARARAVGSHPASRGKILGRGLGCQLVAGAIAGDGFRDRAHFWPPGAAFAAFAPPERITVVTDFDYPPYLFTSDDGELKGIIRDKWQRWSEKTGIPAEVKGKTWIDAQRSVQQGIDDVIETLSYTPDRAAAVRVLAALRTGRGACLLPSAAYRRSVTSASMRGFTIGAKRGSACGNWLSERGIALREYPTLRGTGQCGGIRRRSAVLHGFDDCALLPLQVAARR